MGSDEQRQHDENERRRMIQEELGNISRHLRAARIIATTPRSKTTKRPPR